MSIKYLAITWINLQPCTLYNVSNFHHVQVEAKSCDPSIGMLARPHRQIDEAHFLEVRT